MNLINPKNIEYQILNLLQNGEKETSSLLTEIRKNRPATKQGFYQALRKLKTEETVLIYKRKVSLNTVWIKKMRDLIDKISKIYTVNQNIFDVLELEDKESISYSFNNIKSLDIFWGHSQNILIHNTDHFEPIYCYDPHYWFYIARKNTETELIEEIVRNKRQFLITVGGTTRLDKSIKKNFNNDYLQYNCKKLFNKSNYYVTVIGNYITEVTLDQKISDQINEIFQNENLDTTKAAELLKTFLESKTKNKIKISRNERKAKKIKNIIGKDFYIFRK